MPTSARLSAAKKEKKNFSSDGHKSVGPTELQCFSAFFLRITESVLSFCWLSMLT